MPSMSFLSRGLCAILLCAAPLAAQAAPAPKLQFTPVEWDLARGVARQPGLAAWYGATALAPVFTPPEAAPRRAALIAAAAQAPASTMEFLFTALMLALKEQGYAAFSLGMAPFSGLDPERSRRLWDRFGALLYQRGGRFYNFAGLRAFKAKFDPDWRPHYLATSGSLLPVAALVDAARLISRRAGAQTVPDANV